MRSWLVERLAARVAGRRWRCPRRTVPRALLLAPIVAVGAAACSMSDRRQNNDYLLNLRISDGRLLRQAVGGESATTILVYDPADCFACYGALESFLGWRRNRAGAVLLVFTRLPTPDEARALAPLRIVPDVVLDSTAMELRRRTPFGIWLRNDSIVTVDQFREGDIRPPLLDSAMAHKHAALSSNRWMGVRRLLHTPAVQNVVNGTTS